MLQYGRRSMFIGTTILGFESCIKLRKNLTGVQIKILKGEIFAYKLIHEVR